MEASVEPAALEKTGTGFEIMSYIYAISDIHGCLEALKTKMEKVDLTGDNKIVLCGDYIDYGAESKEVLSYLFDLQHNQGSDKVIILKGDHEVLFLDWIDTYLKTKAGRIDEYGMPYWNDWLDANRGFGTFGSFVTDKQWEFFKKALPTMSEETKNIEAVDMILATNSEIISWMREMPLYYETDTQIFVHAGVDEEAGDMWKWGTDEYYLMGTFAKATGHFYKTVIAGHVGTHNFWHDKYNEMYWDGDSHYYIDGTVYHGGKLILLRYDTETKEYKSV